MSDFTISDHIIYKNNQLIAFNKPSGIGVQPDQTTDKSLVDLASIYTQSKVHVVHRLDRPASGVVLFPKTTKSLQHLNEQFKQRQIKKHYLAIVANPPKEPSGTLKHFLKKLNKGNKSIALDQPEADAKEAILHYHLRASSERYHLLEIELVTGRHHQIRAQLAAIGSPIKGDVKYGFRRGNRDRSIHLHAWKLEFQHPVSLEKVCLSAPPPKDPVWDAMGEQFTF